VLEEAFTFGNSVWLAWREAQDKLPGAGRDQWLAYATKQALEFSEFIDDSETLYGPVLQALASLGPNVLPDELVPLENA
jgi:hypothetical protein